MSLDANENGASGRDTPGTPCNGASAETNTEPRWKAAIRTFPPIWFTTTMGTGVTSILLQRLPYPAAWLYWLSVIVFALNVVLFVLCAIALSARLLFFRGGWNAVRRDYFLGAVPIGLGCLVNMFCYVCVDAWGEWAATMAWVLWMIEAALGMAIAFIVPFSNMTPHPPRDITSLEAFQLMPFNGPLAAALSGSIVAGILPNERHALWTVVTSYALWGAGMLPSGMVLTLWHLRLILRGLPPRNSVLTTLLPMAPTGLASISIFQLGVRASTIFPATHFLADGAGAGALAACAAAALSLWGWALLWLAQSVASAVYAGRIPFEMSWWDLTFPPGMLALTTIVFGDQFSAEFFSVLGTIFAVAVMLLWIMVALGTARAVIIGKLLPEPGAAGREDEKKDELEARRKRDEEA